MDGRSRVVVLDTPERTRSFGVDIAALFLPNTIFALSGDLGSGKTSFVKGVAEGLGISSTIQSPTFTYLNVYEEGRIPLYHFDLYRINKSEDFFSMGFEEYFEKGGITMIEWAERLEKQIPEAAISLSFYYWHQGRKVDFAPPIAPNILRFLDSWN